MGIDRLNDNGGASTDIICDLLPMPGVYRFIGAASKHNRYNYNICQLYDEITCMNVLIVYSISSVVIC